MVLGCVASLQSYSSPLPHGGPLPRASSLVNGSVADSGYRRSSGPGGPAAWYCTISWHHRSVRSARRKVVTSFRSSFSSTSRVVSLVSRVSFPWLGYSQPLSPPFGLVDSLVSSRHTFHLSPSPWSVVSPCARFRPSGDDPDLCLTGFGIWVFLTVGWFLGFLVGVCFVGIGSFQFFVVTWLLYSAPGRLVRVLDQGFAPQFPPP